METILEQQRRYHEERERLMDAMVKEIMHKKNGHRETINSDHRLKMLMDQYTESTIHLKEFYEDKDGLRKEEVSALSGPNEFQEFYNRLKQIKEFYRKHPDEITVPMSVEFEELAKLRDNPSDETNMVDFSDEEGYGKYLDLHECYEKYINLKGIEKVDYVTYIGLFDHLFDIQRERKNGEYRNYIRSLLQYLKDFVGRVKPLLDPAQEMAQAHQEFLKQWDNGTFPGWPKETGGALSNVGAHLDLSAFSSWEELASLGLDRLKSALMALGLKCGGTLEERAQRLFSTKGQAALDRSLVAKKASNRGKASTQHRHKDIAAIEAQIYSCQTPRRLEDASVKMETILEQQRRYHEERERLMDAMVKEIMHKKNGHRETINSDHRLKMLMDQYTESTIHLKEFYEDKDGLRKEEVSALSGPNEFQEFYNRLKQIKEFYRKHPDEITVPMSVEFEELAKLRDNPSDETNMVDFSDEEGYGKYLDLHECYEKYINLKGIEKVDYVTYIGLFDHLFDIQRERKNGEYRNYIRSLLQYLKDFVGRVKPLLDPAQEMAQAHQEFLKQWDNGTFPGWPKETGGALSNVGAHLDLSAFSSWEELASLGLDRLKSALMALGLKCGGTLEERAQRLFSTKGQAALDRSLVAKKASNRGKASTQHRHKDIAAIEAQIYRYSTLVSEQRAATKENVQRKQARTAGERGDSSGDESEPESDGEGDEDEVLCNPKNLPLGWDGKPIPYWLYKLHGLNISYSCEICGNFTYKGPKAFQTHFAEWRHAHGMRCLGIPNTAHFANVTQIEDALALWEKLKQQKEGERWVAENDEEYEDSLGNVVNRKTFEDLKRQGLL